MNELEQAEMEADKRNEPERTVMSSLTWGCILMLLFWSFAIIAGVSLYGCNG